MNLADKLKEQEAQMHADRIEMLMPSYCWQANPDQKVKESIEYHASEYKRIMHKPYQRWQEQREE